MDLDIQPLGILYHKPLMFDVVHQSLVPDGRREGKKCERGTYLPIPIVARNSF